MKFKIGTAVVCVHLNQLYYGMVINYEFGITTINWSTGQGRYTETDMRVLNVASLCDGKMLHEI